MHQRQVDDKELQAKIDLFSQIENIVSEASNTSGEKPNGSDSSRKKGINANRKIEKALNRETEAFELGKSNKGKNAEILSLNGTKQNQQMEDTNTIDLIVKKQKEALERIHEQSDNT